MRKNILLLLFLLMIINNSLALSSEDEKPTSNQVSAIPNEVSNDGKKIKIGLYGIGLDTYWSQFEGLYERLQGYQQQIAKRMSAKHETIEVINTGIVDNPQKAREVGTFLAKQNVDAIFLYISTYALSSTVLPVVREVDVPVIVLSLQPSKAIEYTSFNALGDRGKMTGEWLAYCQACSAPEIASVFNRAKIDYHLITGSLDDESSWNEIDDWLNAVKVASILDDTRIGALGHYYEGMLDVYSDMTQLSSTFGCHFEILEMSTLYKYYNETTNAQIQEKIKQFHDDFEVDPACDAHEISRAARSAAALEALVHPVAGEYEIKNVIAMKIMDLMGIGGSFSEFYALDLNDDIILLGHDGPGHARIAKGKVKLVPLPVYHGKPGKGLSIQMSVQQGPITLLSVVQQTNGEIALLVAEGECVPGPTLNIGNTNSRYRFSIGAGRFLKEWSEQGPAHHMAIGIGHAANQLEKLAKILGIKFIKIC
jgi:L-arabinose isomerase